MKKLGYLFLLVIFMIPTFVYAEETCDNKGVSIKMIELKKTTGLTEELSDVELEDNKINLDVKMYEVGDSIEYKVIIKNDSKEDYVVNDKSSNEDNTIEYRLEAKDGSNKIKKGTEETFILKATYKTEVEQEQFRSGKFDASSTVLLKVEEAKLIPIDINPKTGNIFYLLISLMLGVSIIFLFKIKNKKVQTLMLSVFMLLPVSVLAECDYNIKLNSNIIIGYVKPNPCTYDGELVQGAEYVNGQYTYRYMQEGTYNTSTSLYEWKNIENDGWGVRLSDLSSTDPVTTTLCTSINDKPIVSMSQMFYNSKTTNIDTSSFDTNKVTNMEAMFLGCSGITEINVTNFDTSNVTYMPAMFSGCSGITEINVTNFDTSNVTNMQSLFYGCSSLTELDLTGFDLRGGNSFGSIAGGIFGGTSSLKKINLSNMKLPADMSQAIFRSGNVNSSPIEEIDVTGWDLSQTTNAFGMLGANGSNGLGGTGLKRIIGLDTWDTSHITNMSQLFQGLSLTSIDLSTFDTSNVISMDQMFTSCSNLTTVILDNFDLSKNPTMNSIFATPSLKKISAKNWKIPSTFSISFFKEMSVINVEEIDVTGWDLSSTTSLSYTFTVNYNSSGNESLKRIVGLPSWDIYNTKLSYLFEYLNGVETLDLSGWDFSNQNIDSLIHNLGITHLYGLKSLDLSRTKYKGVMRLTFGYFENGLPKEFILNDVDTSEVTSMAYLFGYSKSLSKVDISDFDTSNVTDMSYMFSQCYNLVDLTLGNIDTSKVENMEWMFSYLKSMKNMDISYLDTTSLKNISYIFAYCDNLETLNLSNFVSPTTTNTQYIFVNCPKLDEVYLDNWNIGRVNDLNTAFFCDQLNPIGFISMKNWIIPEDFHYFSPDADMLNIKKIDVSNWDLTKVKNLSEVFKESYKLQTIIGLDTWDTSHVENMEGMFKYCYDLLEVDISSFDYSKVKNISYMFDESSSIKKIKLGNFNAAVLENASYSFSYLSNLEELIIDSISTPNLINATGMFRNSPKLKRLDLRGMDTSHVTDMSSMFSGNTGLEYLDLSTFETNASQAMSSMFYKCTSLTTAYAKTQADADRFNASSSKADNVQFVVKN